MIGQQRNILATLGIDVWIPRTQVCQKNNAHTLWRDQVVEPHIPINIPVAVDIPAFEQASSDPELLEGQFPKNAKMNAPCAQSMPLQFDLDEKDLATFEKGAKVAKADAVILRTRNGRVEMVAAEVDDNGNIEHGSSSFVYRTKIETEHEFNLGIPKASLLFLPGSYKVMVNQKFIIFEGEVVRYVATALGWSKFDLN